MTESFSLASHTASRGKSRSLQPSQDADTNRPAQGPVLGFRQACPPSPRPRHSPLNTWLPEPVSGSEPGIVGFSMPLGKNPAGTQVALIQSHK